MLEENTNPEAELETTNSQEGTSTEEKTLDVESTEDKGDPLDGINDADALRNEAKKYRAIASRTKKHEAAPVKEDEEEDEREESPFLSRKDFYRANEKKAIKLVTTTDPEVDANWNSIKEFYVSRRGKDTPEDIAEDINDAVILWKARQKPKQENPLETFQKTAVRSPSGGTPSSTKTTSTDPRFSSAARPDSWYPTKK